MLARIIVCQNKLKFKDDVMILMYTDIDNTVHSEVMSMRMIHRCACCT